jgi:amicoumacin kinase
MMIEHFAKIRWGADSGSLHFIGNSENAVYAINLACQRHYLRLTPASHREFSQIEAELEYIRYLHSNGLSVAIPVVSSFGRNIEILEDAERWLGCVFKEATGDRYTFSDQTAAQHFHQRGQFLGAMHNLARRYTPIRQRRFSWDEDPRVKDAETLLPESETVVRNALEECRRWLQSLARTPDCFGMVHGDLGSTNVHCTENGLTAFDFDDCCYHWFAYDLAVVLYPHGFRINAAHILQVLLDGYHSQMSNEIDAAMALRFCQWRLIYMFLTRAEKWGFQHLSHEQIQWYIRTRENIARGYALA